MPRAAKLFDLEKVEAAVLEQLAPFLAGLDYLSAAELCLDALTGPPPAGQAESLERIFYALWFLEQAQLHRRGDAKTMRMIADIAELLLSRCGFPIDGPSPQLYGRVYWALSEWYRAGGDAWQAMWHFALSQQLGSEGKRTARRNPAEAQRSTADIALVAGDRAFDLGQMESAASNYMNAEDHTQDLRLQGRARLGRITSLRLLGDVDTAHSLATTAGFEFSIYPDLVGEYAWQEAMCEVSSTRQSTALEPFLIISGHKVRVKFAISASLVAYALPHAQILKKIRRVRTFRNNFSDDVGRATAEFHRLKQLATLEKCYDPSINTVAKLKDLGLLLGEQRETLPFDQRLVFLAAAMRWLSREQRSQFLAYIIDEYTSLSLKLSQGRKLDVLGLVSDLVEQDQVGPDSPSGFASRPALTGQRMLKISSLVARAGLASMQHKIGGSPKKIGDFQHYLAEFISVMIDVLGPLRGPLRCLVEFAASVPGMPEPAQHKIRDALSLQEPLANERFYQTFRGDHGTYPQRIFRNWCDAPVAVGGLARTYRAELKDGRPVAVKILYPGLMAETVNQIKIARSIQPVLRYLHPDLAVDRIFELILNSNLDDCDLRTEAQRHQEIEQFFRTSRTWFAGQVYPEYSSRNVLVSDCIDGEPLDQFLSQASPEAAARLFASIEEASFKMHAGPGLVCLAPQASSFRIAHERVAWVDFSSMMRIDASHRQLQQMLWQAIQAQDDEALYNFCIKAGVCTAEVDREVYNSFIAPIITKKFNPYDVSQQHDVFKWVEQFYAGRRWAGIHLSGQSSLVYITSFLRASMFYRSMAPSSRRAA